MAKPFGIQHIIFFVVFVAIAIAIVLLHKRFIKTPKQKNFAIKIMAGILLVAILSNRISIGVYEKSFLRLIPDTYCGVVSILLSLAVLFIPNRNHEVFHFLVYIAFFGALCNNVYPDYLGQGATIFHSRTITGLFHHTISIYVVILLIVNGDTIPSLKKWWCLPLGLCAMIAYGLICIEFFDYTNSMKIYSPILPNTPIKWHLICLFYIVMQMVSIAIYLLVIKKRKRICNKNCIKN